MSKIIVLCAWLLKKRKILKKDVKLVTKIAEQKFKKSEKKTNKFY